jgi:hypothetical protein
VRGYDRREHERQAEHDGPGGGAVGAGTDAQNHGPAGPRSRPPRGRGGAGGRGGSRGRGGSDDGEVPPGRDLAHGPAGSGPVDRDVPFALALSLDALADVLDVGPPDTSLGSSRHRGDANGCLGHQALVRRPGSAGRSVPGDGGDEAGDRFGVLALV